MELLARLPRVQLEDGGAAMNPLEVAIRAACAYLGANPDSWRGFEGAGRAAIEGLLSALPPDLASALRLHLGTEPTP